MTFLTADFHTHILPGIDDGCPTADEAIQMLHMEFEQGVERVFLTPHFLAQQMYPDTFLASRHQSLEILKDLIASDDRIPELIPGAEVKYCPGISKWEQLDMLALGDTRHILIELSPLDLSGKLFEELETICFERDLIPIIAHVERCLPPLYRRSILKKLSYLPVVLQYNCSYFLDKMTKRTAFRLLKDHQVHLISSDCHCVSWRPPCIQQVRELILSQSAESEIAFLSDMEDRIKSKHQQM